MASLDDRWPQCFFPFLCTRLIAISVAHSVHYMIVCRCLLNAFAWALHDFHLSPVDKAAACLISSSAGDTAGKGRSKKSSNKWAHGYHLVKGQSGHDMEDYHVAEHRYERGHELGLYAIFDGHLGDSVPSYLKGNLFTNILKEVSDAPDSLIQPFLLVQTACR